MAVVDDDFEVRVALMRLLLSAGFETQTFASGAELAQSIEQRTPSCVHMPGVSGFDMQQLLDETHPEVPVVIITGRDTAEARRRALSHRVPVQASRRRGLAGRDQRGAPPLIDPI